MSSCGMMMTRELYKEVGGWPEELGVYGGGENFMNFTLSVMGKKKWVCYTGPLYHHGEKRGYKFNPPDYERNRIIATYLFGGGVLAGRFVANRQTYPSKRQLWAYLHEIRDKCAGHREWIKERQVTTIEEWANNETRLDNYPSQSHDGWPNSKLASHP